MRIFADVEGLILGDSLSQSQAQNLPYKRYEPDLLAMRIANHTLYEKSELYD